MIEYKVSKQQVGGQYTYDRFINSNGKFFNVIEEFQTGRDNDVYMNIKTVNNLARLNFGSSYNKYDKDGKELAILNSYISKSVEEFLYDLKENNLVYSSLTTDSINIILSSQNYLKYSLDIDPEIELESDDFEIEYILHPRDLETIIKYIHYLVVVSKLYTTPNVDHLIKLRDDIDSDSFDDYEAVDFIEEMIGTFNDDYENDKQTLLVDNQFYYNYGSGEVISFGALFNGLADEESHLQLELHPDKKASLEDFLPLLENNINKAMDVINSRRDKENKIPPLEFLVFKDMEAFLITAPINKVDKSSLLRNLDEHMSLEIRTFLSLLAV